MANLFSGVGTNVKHRINHNTHQNPPQDIRGRNKQQSLINSVSPKDYLQFKKIDLQFLKICPLSKSNLFYRNDKHFVKQNLINLRINLTFVSKKNPNSVIMKAPVMQVTISNEYKSLTISMNSEYCNREIENVLIEISPAFGIYFGISTELRTNFEE